jgi:hypothetical protein
VSGVKFNTAVDFIDQLFSKATATDMFLGAPIDPNQVYSVARE